MGREDDSLVRGRSPILAMRAFARAMAKMAVVAGMMLAAGFVWFVAAIPAEEIELKGNADGIVVLTGGASRIADAVELLAAGRGKRLLISGVHPATHVAEIAKRNPAYERLFACCVDLDRSALNTVGNAIQTRHWVEAKGFRSLIVVTSSYHLPRSMAELSRQLPDVALVPFPVVTDKLRTERWWSPPTMRLLLSEYLKYMFAHVRMRLEPSTAATGLAGARADTKG